VSKYHALLTDITFGDEYLIPERSIGGHHQCSFLLGTRPTFVCGVECARILGAVSTDVFSLDESKERSDAWQPKWEQLTEGS
jgi:hypothetical protein